MFICSACFLIFLNFLLTVSEENVTKLLAGMKKQVQAVENDIKGFKPSADNDKFKEVMKISFYDTVI